jgi:hypothetical protein
MAHVVDTEVIAVVFDTMVHGLIYTYCYDSQILFPDVFRYGVLFMQYGVCGWGWGREDTSIVGIPKG